MGKDKTRFCPLHGDYAVLEQDTACPQCRVDPEGSTISLQRVRVHTTGAFETLATGDSLLTPINEDLPCPVCGTDVPLDDFRHEAIGEEWTREAAEWAEEGVCPSCYRSILPPYIREWSDGEWLSHHYEGWRTTVEAVTSIRRYQDSAQESWLPREKRHKLLDVEATLSARREHLALCQSAMDDLCQRYPSSMTPPPFEQMLSVARDKSLSTEALEELQAIHDGDAVVEVDRREDSMVIRADDEGLSAVARVATSRVATEPRRDGAHPDSATRSHGVQSGGRWPRLLAAAAVFAVLIWLLSRV